MRIYNRLTIAIMTGMFLSCNEGSSVEETKNANPCLTDSLKDIISLYKIDHTQHNEIITLTGNITYDENKVYRFVPLLSGVVKQVHFSLGDFVKKGQILLEIRSADLNDMNAELSEANNRLKVAERQLEATQNLYADGVAADKDVLEAQSDHSNAAAAVKKIKESLALYGGNVTSGTLTIKAQNTGYIVEKNVVDGQQIAADGSPLFVIGDLSTVWVMANVYTGHMPSIRVGQQVAIHTTAYQDKVFKGRITRLSNVVDPDEKVLKAVIALDNKEQLLKPEMMANIDVYLDQKSSLVALPQQSVIFDNESYHLIKLNGPCNVEVIDFIPEYEDDTHYFTASDNINLGDTIVQQNSLLLYNKLIGR